EKFFTKSAELYKKLIPITLKRPVVTLVVATALFACTLLVGSLLKQEFIPPQDQSRLTLRITTPVGSSLTFTDNKIQEIEKYLSSRPEVDSYFSTIGGTQVNTANISINLKPANQRKLSAQKLSVAFREDFKKIKDARVIISDPSLAILGGKRNSPVAFTLKGSDWNKLVELSQKMQDEMEKSGMMTDIDSNYLDGMPEIQVTPDRVKARLYGVDVAEISQTVSSMMAGTIAAKYTNGGRRYDVRVGLPPESRTSVDTIKSIFVRNNRGELIPLDRVTKIEEKSSLQSITREDRQRAISLRANVSPKSSQAEAIAEVQKIAKNLPSGYYVSISGSAKTFQESFSSLIFALMLGIIVSYMVLASQFNSFVHPITILIALPFSVSGAFLALYLGGQTLNIYSMIGLILLMGIVKKNSILLVEFTNHMKEKGLNTNEALLEACPVRLRPILMTSIATIAGAIPAALAIGPGAESRIPMALAVIGGVTVSTMLTLFVVPCVYSLFDRIKVTKSEEVEVPHLTNEHA
ncbi:MAG: efflux RND transporter permease subunit, partial [Pseudobdellovibrio sp.]